MTKKRKFNYFIPIAVIAAVVLVIFTNSKPFNVYEQQKAKADGMRSELDVLQKGNTKLREKDQMMNPVQKEEEARRMGYVRQNEQTIPDRSQKAPVEKEAPAVPKPRKDDPSTQPIDLKGNDKNEEIPTAPE